MEQGGAVTPFYDPMIAKLIAYGATRDEARERLAEAAADIVVWPVRTNAGFLVQALEHPAFVSGAVDTGLIAREGEALMPPELPSDEALATSGAALAMRGTFANFRLNAPPRSEARFLLDGRPVVVDLSQAEPVEPAASPLMVSEAGQTWAMTPWRIDGAAAGGAGDGAIVAPMPGRVIAVDVAAGQQVAKGQRLLTLEAMKMEHALVAPFDGTVTDLVATDGAQVAEGTTLARVEPAA